MLYFLAYVFIFAGATSITAAILRRFVFRRRLIFELTDVQRILVFAAGLALLAGSVLLYAYAEALAAAEAAVVMI